MLILTFQLGQPKETDGIHNVTVENFIGDHLGDDPIAFFNVISGGLIRKITLTILALHQTYPCSCKF